MSTIDLSSARWRKTNHSNADYNCVEVADLDCGRHAIRDSKHPTGPALLATPSQWAAFTAGIRGGEFG